MPIIFTDLLSPSLFHLALWKFTVLVVVVRDFSLSLSAEYSIFQSFIELS